MNLKKLVLCDLEEEYARHMTEFLKSHREVPWEIYTYTQVEGLESFIRKEAVRLLVVAENAYTQGIREMNDVRIVLLNESGIMKWPSVRNVDKYQQAESVYKEILEEYMDVAGVTPPRFQQGTHTRLLGLYSPVRRCLQTSFALTMGQMLAQKYRTLYLNFEHYAGITELLPDIQTRDLADLIFFLNTEQDRFMLRFQTILQKKGKMDYIPPVKYGTNLLEISEGDWLNLLHRIMESGEYDYIILDLSENIQGLFSVLRLCHRIYTLMKDDRMARGKVMQYEQLLMLSDYRDVMEKTSKYRLPRFRKLPEEIEQLTKGDLAEYVREVLKEVTE